MDADHALVTGRRIPLETVRSVESLPLTVCLPNNSTPLHAHAFVSTLYAIFNKMDKSSIRIQLVDAKTVALANATAETTRSKLERNAMKVVTVLILAARTASLFLLLATITTPVLPETFAAELLLDLRLAVAITRALPRLNARTLLATSL